MRIFIALDIDDAIRVRIQRFTEGVREFAPDARWVRPESLHVTLKFIGERSESKVKEIEQAVARIHSAPFDLTFCGHGFFPSPKAARVFWIGIDAGPQLAALVKSIDNATAILGVPKEDHAFSPHLTLARGGRGSGTPHWSKGDDPNRTFQKLQEKLAAVPVSEFGTMTAREFFLYESQLLKGGPKYTKLARFALLGE